MFGNFFKNTFSYALFSTLAEKVYFPPQLQMNFLVHFTAKTDRNVLFSKNITFVKTKRLLFLNSRITYTEFISLTRSPFSNKFLESLQFWVQYQIFVLWYAHLLVCNIVGNAALQVISKLVFQLPDGHVFTNCIRNSFFMPSTFLCQFNLLVSVYLYICSIGL